MGKSIITMSLQNKNISSVAWSTSLLGPHAFFGKLKGIYETGTVAKVRDGCIFFKDTCCKQKRNGKVRVRTFKVPLDDERTQKVFTTNPEVAATIHMFRRTALWGKCL